jgi:DNA polymerase III epsilon subunit-like protein
MSTFIFKTFHMTFFNSDDFKPQIELESLARLEEFSTYSSDTPEVRYFDLKDLLGREELNLQTHYHYSSYYECLRQIGKLLHQFFPEGFIIIDLETSGISAIRDQIIEISAIKWTLSTWKRQRLKTFVSLVYTSQALSSENQKIHGITNNDLSKAAPLSEVLDQWLEFAENLPIIAYNGDFDGSFLTQALIKERKNLPHQSIYCLHKLAKLILGTKHSAGFGVRSLCQFFDILQWSAHRAFMDSLNAFKICLHLFSHPKFLSLQEQLSTDIILKKIWVFDLNQVEQGSLFELYPQYKHLEKIIMNPNETTYFIKYGSGSKGKGWRPIKVLGFSMSQHGPLLVAQCLIDQVTKNFYLHRVLDWKDHL